MSLPVESGRQCREHQKRRDAKPAKGRGCGLGDGSRLCLQHVQRHARGAGLPGQGGVPRAARLVRGAKAPSGRHRPALGRERGGCHAQPARGGGVPAKHRPLPAVLPVLLGAALWVDSRSGRRFRGNAGEVSGTEGGHRRAAVRDGAGGAARGGGAVRGWGGEAGGGPVVPLPAGR